MTKRISQFILKQIDWKTAGHIDNIPDKCIFCVAPHTSNWDLLLGLIVYKSVGKKASFLIKKDWFFFPMNLIFRALNGIPVDRSKKMSLTEQCAQLFEKYNPFQLAITPEATRKPNAEWKRGFYYIALKANVPIVIVALDYGRKVVDFKEIFIPTGDADADMIKIKSFYKDAIARHPEKFLID